MLYVGIDNGLNGGIVVINEKQEVVLKIVMPTIKCKGKTEYDVNSITELFDDWFGTNVCFAVLEKAHVRPISGKRACFMNGFGYGLLQGLLNNISYEIISPQVWMKELGINSKDEKGSIKYCLKKYPKERWTATERCKKYHDGLTDAACMAVYCYRRNR